MRIAIVVQRYGDEAIGGAEKQARGLSHGFARRQHEVTVFTTCARDHRDWANYYPDGITEENGITIRRFWVQKERNWNKFGRKTGWISRIQNYLPARHRIKQQEKWIDEQGPLCPDLVSVVGKQKEAFDCFIFLTYLYYPTVRGLPKVAEKAVLVSTAHDEKPLYFDVYKEIFAAASFLVFLSPEEEELVKRVFPEAVSETPSEVIGVGTELGEPSAQNQGFYLYLGRIEEGKGCAELFDYCKQANRELVCAGSAQLSIPEWVDYRGSVDEETKLDLINRCEAMVVPSPNESFSITAIEAWAQGKPVIASRRSPVLAGHIERSKGGALYADFAEFRSIEVTQEQGLAGYEYVSQHYSWDKVLDRWEESVLVHFRNRNN